MEEYTRCAQTTGITNHRLFCLLGAHASLHVHTFVTRPSCCPFSDSAEWACKAEPRQMSVTISLVYSQLLRGLVRGPLVYLIS